MFKSSWKRPRPTLTLKEQTEAALFELKDLADGCPFFEEMGSNFQLVFDVATPDEIFGWLTQLRQFIATIRDGLKKGLSLDTIAALFRREMEKEKAAINNA